MTYQTVIIASWAAFIVVWSIGAFNVKRDIRGSGFSLLGYRSVLLRVAVAVLVAFVALRIMTGTAHYTRADSMLFGTALFAAPLALGWVAAAFAALGIAFAIWARIHLGRNWSSAPAVKESHELVTSGPYRYVRHPIYTGVLFAALGFALTGAAIGIGIFVVVCAIFLRRIRIEERIMIELFPDAYPAYQARTKRLIPFVW